MPDQTIGAPESFDVAEQRRSALSEANRRRLGALARRREIGRLDPRRGERQVAELLRIPDEITGSMRLERLLGSIRWIGPTRIARILAHAQIRPRRLPGRVRELSVGERARLAGALEER